jgi:phosphoribosylaminoimidazolecarboxamide formyltransferase/IMP cyclohydrolase
MAKRALISVSDKRGLKEFAEQLLANGFEILSTGGTAASLRDAGVDVIDVAEVTEFPEIMDGRVKTLHPKIHGGILARTGTDDEALALHGIDAIDVVVINLYPFEATIAAQDCTREIAVENIDIGGPAMIRAAAKNHDRVIVVVNPADYGSVAEALNAGGGEVDQAMREKLAMVAYAHTACYDAAIWNWFAGQSAAEEFPDQLPVGMRKIADLRYGENPHQASALYGTSGTNAGTVVGAKQVQGKPLSFNNLADADSAWQCVQSMEGTACVIVKHANPCGVALGESNMEAYERAYACDPTSAFGGIIAFNAEVDEKLAGEILDRQFVEVLIAPSYSDGAVSRLMAKPNVRVLDAGGIESGTAEPYVFEHLDGGMLVQQPDTGMVCDHELKVVTARQPDEQQMSDAMLAWRVAKFVKSNAIVFVRDGATIGVGAGQMSRVISARIAGMKAAEAGIETEGATMASDAFFPFRDGIDIASEYGIATVIQPGGSMRDSEVIEAADEHNMAMILTGMRHFRH